MNERDGVKRSTQSMGGRVIGIDSGMVQRQDKRDKSKAGGREELKV